MKDYPWEAIILWYGIMFRTTTLMHSLNRSAWTLNWAQKIMWRCSQNTLSWTCVRNIAQNKTVTSVLSRNVGSLTAYRAKNHDCLPMFSSKLAIYMIQYQMKTTLVITRSSQISMARRQQRNSSRLSALPTETTQFNLIR